MNAPAMPHSKQANDKQSFLSLMAYAMPAFPLAALTLPVTIYLPTYYAKDLGLGLASVGFILLLARAIDVLTDPVIGYFSDQTKSRHGRRKIWILGGLPFVLLASYFLFIPTESASAIHLLIWSVVLYIGWTCMILPLMALGAELSDNYNERSKISGFRECAIVAGVLTALTLIATTSSNTEPLTILAIFIIITLPLGTALFWFFLREKPCENAHNINFSDGMRVLAKNKPFRHLIIAYLINGLANAFPATLFLLYVEFGLGMKDQTGPLLFTYFLSGLLAVPFWLWLSQKYSKHKTWCYAMIWACAFFLCVPLVQEGDFIFFFAICILTGLSLGADLTLPASMQADVVDLDRLETGQQRTGLYFALWSMATKLSLALAAGIAFPTLEFGGFTNENPDNVFLLVMLYAVIPVFLKIFAIALMWRHSLDEETVLQTQQEILRKWS